MSQQDDLILLGNAFFVDESKDDFTFYLDAASHSESITELEELFNAVKTADDTKKRFSLSEQIIFTNLNPDETSPEFDNAIWARLASDTAKSTRYLRSKLETVAQANEKAVLERLETESPLTAESREVLSTLLRRALSPSNVTDLPRQPWLKSSLTREQKKAYAKLTTIKDERISTRYLLQVTFPEIKWKFPKGRALICFSHAGRCLSVTVRKQDDKVGYKPKEITIEEQKNRETFLFSVSEYCASIKEVIFEGGSSAAHAQGLLVITGPTKSLKSEITRGLIHLYLEDNKKPNQRLHLVTFEDPIERLYTNLDYPGSLRVALPRDTKRDDVNYTPRQKQRDAGFLREALADALRQTPAVFFVGETRSKEEWEVLLDFAATGHLIVTTAHAGSLVEAMHKIFEAREVKTAADRGEIANKLLAVVNLKPGRLDVPGNSTGTEVVYPALWRRSPRGVAGLTSDGLSALLPHRNVSGFASCLGRRWFIDKLIGHVQVALTDAEVHDAANCKHADRTRSLFATIQPKARKQACSWDLQGV